MGDKAAQFLAGNTTTSDAHRISIAGNIRILK
jgi:hypothetical protein